MNLPVIAGLALFFIAGSASADIIVSATERENQKLVSVDLTTSTVTLIHNTPDQPDSLVLDTQGRFIFSEPLANQIRRFDPIANTDTDTLIADATVGISSPQDLVLDPTGQFLLASNATGNTITKTNLATAACTPACTGTTILTHINFPEGLVFDTVGRLFALAGFNSPDSGIYQIDPNTGTVLTSHKGFDPANQLDGLTFDPSTNRLFATSSGLTTGSDSVYSIDPATLVATKIATIPTPDGIINDTHGTLFVASRNGFVYSVNESNNAVTQFTVPVPTLDDLGIVAAQPPTGLKTFGVPSVPTGGTTTLNIQITNTNTTATLIGVGFTDTLPAGIVVATIPGVVNSCGGAVTGATAGSGAVSLSGATLAAGAFCTVTLNVTDNNAFPSMAQNSATVTSQNGGVGNTTTATLSITPPPSVPMIAKSFGSATIPLNGATSLSFTITNQGVSTLMGVGFTDPLPAGLTISTPNGLTGTCGGGAITATAGSGTVSLSGAALAAGASCNFSVNVTGTTAGIKNNSVQVTSTNGGPGNTSMATLTVVGPPTISKSFSASSVVATQSTTLSFLLTNPNATVALTGVGFSDLLLPTGVNISTPSVVTGSCGGGTITALGGTTTISLAGATLAAGGSCSFAVSVTGVTPGGPRINTTTAVTSTNGGNGGMAMAPITVTVAIPPVTTKTFGQPGIPLGGTTTLTFLITNQNTAVPLTGVGFTDPLPAGLALSTPTGLPNGTCGAVTATPPGTISVTGVSLAAGASCTFFVNVTGTAVGMQNNVTSPVTSNVGIGPPAPGNINVTPPSPPAITKTFNPNTILLNGISTLSFSITNPNTTTALTGVGFTDTLPAVLIISTPNGLTGTCGGGTITAPAGTNTIGLTGTTLAASGTCTFSVNVMGTTAGVSTNTTSNVTSNEGGPGNTATAGITVAGPAQVTDAFQIQYIPNLNVGDGVVNITNAGSLGADPFGPLSGTTGRICVNVYTFSPDEQEISCCSCLVTPNALVHLGAKTDLIGNTLTSVVPNSIVVKLLATIPLSTAGTGGTNAGPFTGSTCNAASPFDTTNLAPGMRAWATKLHALPASPAYGVTEGRFQTEPLSPGELTKLTTLCRFIVGNGSGAGICKSCTLGGLGADKR